MKVPMFGQYDNLCRIEVNGAILAQNYRALSAKMPVGPVLKSNAYGHGLVLTAKIFEKLNPPFLCVDSLYEAYELSKAGIKSEILIMGYVGENNLKHKRLPFAFAAYDRETFLMIKKYQPQAPIHLFVDTGMNREGMNLEELSDIVRHNRNSRIAGLMTHFAVADDPGQWRVFNQARKIISPKWVHGVNVRRVGLELYLHRPALRFIAKIVQIKKIKKGDRVGYDFAFTAKKDMTLALLPAGYNEGVDRRLSNVPPIVGRVNMNMTTVDATGRRVRRGDDWDIYPDIKKTARQAGTIPYDLLVHFNPTIKRIEV
ncbi:MAG: alanine racemase [Patescibacteria group bacterium]|nr:alanine racemase [Patescibacteria group bacterium]MCL5432218.1 alanine racemase [Patescibacteria group bacterium]